ncbi:hypothetical protein, partial [Brucella melitensis]|uniref:hypothetical protein n=1 Tax=Brucella melitensis TaxID=29459 RepID=UPI003B684B9E
MKLLLALLATMALVMGAPTTLLPTAEQFKLQYLDVLFENICFDIGYTVCNGADTDKLRYGVFDSTGPNGACQC